MVGAMVTIGDGRPYNTALMVFDADSVGPYAAQHGLADASPAALASDSEVLPALWEPGGDEITLTMKLKRRPIAEKYAAEIEELYASEPGPDIHEPTTAQTAQSA